MSPSSHTLIAKQNQIMTQKQQPRLPKHLHIQPVLSLFQYRKRSPKHILKHVINYAVNNIPYGNWLKPHHWKYVLKDRKKLKRQPQRKNTPPTQILGVNTETRKCWSHHKVSRFLVDFPHKQTFPWIIKFTAIN